jgi:hypothetical protein
VQISGWTVLDLSASHLNWQATATLIDVAKRVRREKDQATCQPRTRVRDQVSESPTLILEIEVLHVTDFAVGCAEFASE